IELGVIVLGALIARVMLLPLPPGLSHDSWRYLWDARVTLNGFSPYVYPPGAKILASLQHTILYTNSRFRNVPTIYPPGAQAVYLLSYLLAPANLYFLKGLFVLFDMVTCIALIVLLGRKGIDQRRVILYAWCPLPIIEFAIQGHVDVITLTFTMLAILASSYHNVRGYVLTGFLVGLATLTKIYPIFLLVVILPYGNDKDMSIMQRVKHHYIPLVGSCCATIIIGYFPYLILGHGQAFGFFAAYASEQGQNAGVTQLIVHWIGNRLGLPLPQTITIEHLVDVFVIGATAVIIFTLRWRNRISMEAGILILFGVVLSISSHVFPWYSTILLLWVPVLLVPFWSRTGLVGQGLAVIAVWYFTTVALLSYFFNPVQGNSNDWTAYYRLVYWPVVVALCVAALISVTNGMKFQKRV
ncbi:MAG TPA: glycosyltransferase 87 family protein, partial [Ktedonobacteraceae bacterium]|nr:glycosyltransferase 87 family protein [Ktedonobacteraceae bacterium]